MAAPRRWSRAEIDKLGRKFDAGQTSGQLAQALNRSRSSIMGVLRRNGYARNQPAPRRWSSAEIDTIRSRFEGGETFAQIAKSMGVTRASIAGLMFRRGYRRAKDP
jgi:hypothetical protein